MRRNPKALLNYLWLGALLGLIPAFAAPAPAADEKTAGGPAATAPAKKHRKSRLTYDESEAVADRRKLVLSAGEDKAVDLDFDANLEAKGISVGNPGIVLPQLVKVGDQRQIIFKPLKAGETTVTLRDTSGAIKVIFTVQITASNLLRRAAEIRDLLRDVEGIEIRVVGQKVIVDGQVIVPADYARVVQVVGNKAYSGDVINLASLSPLSVALLAKKIESDVKVFAPNVYTRVVNGMIFMEGSVDNDQTAKRAMAVALLYLPEATPGNPLIANDPTAKTLEARRLIHNFISIAAPPPRKQDKLVRVTVHFVELAKEYNKTFGFKWQPAFTSDPTITVGQTGAGGTGASGTSFTATLSSLIPKLNSNQTAGFARVLKTGTVIVRSGQSGELNEDTEIPYSVPGPNGTTVPEKITVGMALSVKPQIVGQSEDIQMDIDLNQKGRGPASADGRPTVANHKVKTQVYIKSSESAAIGAVNFNEIGTDFNKDDPDPVTLNANSNGVRTSPLFTMLHSKKYNKKKSQFVIFVTPQIVENASEGSEDLKKNFRVKAK